MVVDPTHPQAVALLRAAAESPEDPTPRLALADWLEEQDDPLAAWVRDANVWAHLCPILPDLTLRDPIPEAVKSLDSPSQEERWRGQAALRTIGPPGVAAARAWARQDPRRRWYELRFYLTSIPPADLRSVPRLIKALNTRNCFDYLIAVLDLNFHGPAAAPAVSSLISPREMAFQANDLEQALSDALFTTLGTIGPPAAEAVPMMMGSITGYNSKADRAAEAILNIRPDPEVVFEHLNTDDESSATRSIDLLSQLAPGTWYLVRVIREHFGDRGADAAAERLAGMGEEARDCVPALLELLRAPREQYQHYTRSRVATALARIWPDMPGVRETIRAILAEYAEGDDSDFEIVEARNALAAVVAELGDETASLEPLLKKLRARNQQVRAAAVRGLGEVAGSAPAAVPHLIRALRDRAGYVRFQAIYALYGVVTAVDPDVLLDPMLAALDDREAEVRRYASRSLAYLVTVVKGDRAERALLALCRAAGDEYETVRMETIDALARRDRLPSAALAPLREFLPTTNHGHYLSCALIALSKVDTLPPEVAQDVAPFLTHSENSIRAAAAAVLAALNPPAG
jgi:uncharacterized protein (TIGR02996 family)